MRYLAFAPPAIRAARVVSRQMVENPEAHLPRGAWLRNSGSRSSWLGRHQRLRQQLHRLGTEVATIGAVVGREMAMGQDVLSRLQEQRGGPVPPTCQAPRGQKAIVTVAHSIRVIAYHVCREEAPRLARTSRRGAVRPAESFLLQSPGEIVPRERVVRAGFAARSVRCRSPRPTSRLPHSPARLLYPSAELGSRSTAWCAVSIAASNRPMLYAWYDSDT